MEACTCKGSQNWFYIMLCRTPTVFNSCPIFSPFRTSSYCLPYTI